jgi:uncharacterized membrane protein YhaH (DUF805 family)
LLSFVLAIPFTAWAFHSGRGRRTAYVAYVVVFLVATLLFVAIQAITAHSPTPDVVDPSAVIFTILFTGIFIVVVVLGVYGFVTRRRRPSDAK